MPQGQIVTGSFLGTGADQNVDVVGFKPRVVHLWNDVADEAYHQKGMPDDSMFKRVHNTGVASKVTTNGITLLDDGFALGADSDLNQSAVRVYFTAWCD